MAYAFGALMRIDFVNFQAHENGIVGAFWFANIAVNALIGDDQSHELPSSQ
jgi:hypothetical protein